MRDIQHGAKQGGALQGERHDLHLWARDGPLQDEAAENIEGIVTPLTNDLQ